MTDNDDFEDLQKTYPGAGSYRFGGNQAQCEKLLKLVRAGKKTANCEALREFAQEPDALPKPGRCDIATLWDGTPTLITRTLTVENVRFCDVSETQAKAEGGLTLDKWRDAQQKYFRREGGFDPEMLLVFETFEVVEDLRDRL